MSIILILLLRQIIWCQYDIRKEIIFSEITTCNFSQLAYITCSGKILAEPADLYTKGNEQSLCRLSITTCQFLFTDKKFVIAVCDEIKKGIFTLS